MKFLEVRNWERHQMRVKPEYRTQFIALHVAVLDDPLFVSLPQSAKVTLIQLWLLRARIGKNILYDEEYLRERIGPYDQAELQWLIDDEWLIVTDREKPSDTKKAKPDSKRYGTAVYPEDFEDWWEKYPRKNAKMDAYLAWEQVENLRPPLHELLSRTEAYAKSVSGNDRKFIKLPAGWLRDRRWEDEDLAPKKKNKKASINKILDREMVDNYMHPRWKEYVSAVIAGETKPGFKEYLLGDK